MVALGDLGMSEDGFALTDVVELVETRSRRTADLYLAAGYRLLTAGVVHYNRRMTEGPHKGELVSLRGHEYVLGRDARTTSLPMSEAIALSHPQTRASDVVPEVAVAP